MDKRYYIEYTTSTDIKYNFNNSIDIVKFKKYRPDYKNYILLVETFNYGHYLDDLTNLYMKFYKMNFFYKDHVELIKEYKSLLRNQKMDNLING